MVAVIPDSNGAKQVIACPKVFRKKLGIRKITNQPSQRTFADEFIRILDALSRGKTVVDLIIPILAVLGIGVAAPAAGWVIVACVVVATGHVGIDWYLSSGGNDNGDPLDPLARALFGFFAPLGLRVAALDGAVTKSERRCIENYFALEWGYSREFVQKELPKLECNVKTFPTVEVVNSLIEFKKAIPAATYEAMAKELTDFLKKVTRADGELHDLEVIFIQWLEIALAKGKPRFWEGLRSTVGISRRPEQSAKGKIGPPPDLDSDGAALRDGRTGNGSSGQSGQPTSTMVGRAYRSTLHWLTT